MLAGLEVVSHELPSTFSYRGPGANGRALGPWPSPRVICTRKPARWGPLPESPRLPQDGSPFEHDPSPSPHGGCLPPPLTSRVPRNSNAPRKAWTGTRRRPWCAPTCRPLKNFGLEHAALVHLAAKVPVGRLEAKRTRSRRGRRRVSTRARDDSARSTVRVTSACRGGDGKALRGGIGENPRPRRSEVVAGRGVVSKSPSMSYRQGPSLREASF